MELEKFEQKINVKFHHKELLKTALTHTSYAYEHNVKSNERLEFLGDAILEYIISVYLFQNYSHLVEGEMTKVRATVVCEKSLYKVAISHDFSDFLFLGRTEVKGNGKNRPAILADSVEAIIAAIYLDQGIEAAQKFILENLKEEVEIASKNVGMKDYKTVLQEKLQEKGNVLIEYEIIHESGPDHNKSFIAQVKYNGRVLATGNGKSKKAAQMEAAKNALEQL